MRSKGVYYMPVKASILPHKPLWVQLNELQILNEALKWGLAIEYSNINLKEPILTRPTQRALLSVILPAMDGLSIVQRTFIKHIEYLKKRARYINKKFFIDPTLLDINNLNLLDEGDYQSGIYPMVFDYAANHDPHDGIMISRLTNEPDSGSSFSSQGLTALIMFPDYGYSMNGLSIPYLAMSGYEVPYKDSRLGAMTIGCNSTGRSLNIEVLDPCKHNQFYSAPKVEVLNY